MEGKEIMKQKLEYSKALGYVLGHINGGCILGERISKDMPFENGHFFILLPENAKLDKLYQFSLGHINPLISSNEVHCVDGKKFIPNIQVTTTWEVSEFIKHFLDKDKSNYAICEDAIQLKKDPPQEISNAKLHFYNEQVYYGLSGNCSIDDIDRAIGRTDNIWHSLIILSSGLDLGETLQDEDFTSAIGSINYVLTSAHDGENYIIWKKDKGSL
jgi:hypothetical protein